MQKWICLHHFQLRLKTNIFEVVPDKAGLPPCSQNASLNLSENFSPNVSPDLDLT